MSPDKPKGGKGRNLLLLALVGLAGLAVGLTAFVLTGEPDGEPAGRPSPEYTIRYPTEVTAVGVSNQEAGCSEVEEPPIQPSKVVVAEPGRPRSSPDHPPYSSTPPTSGWHYTSGLQAAIYHEGQDPDPESAVANLAAGQVVLWHTGLTKEETNDLIGLFLIFKSEDILALPGGELGLEDEIVLTAWGKLQRCERLSGQAIQQFFDKYRGLGPGLD